MRDREAIDADLAAKATPLPMQWSMPALSEALLRDERLIADVPALLARLDKVAALHQPRYYSPETGRWLTERATDDLPPYCTCGLGMTVWPCVTAKAAG